VREIRERTQAPIFLDPQGLLRRIGPNGKIDHFKPEGIEEVCALCDVVKPNELETQILTGIDPREDLEGAASILKSWGIRTVVITLAELGALVAPTMPGTVSRRSQRTPLTRPARAIHLLAG